MRQPIRLIAVLAILSAFVGLPRSVAAAALASTGSKASSLNSFVKGEVLVKFNPRYQAQDRANAIAALKTQRKSVETDIQGLIRDMKLSIAEADKFIESMSKEQ